MYINVRRYQVEPQAVEEIVRRVEEEFVPIVSQAPGFVAYYALDAGDGVIASISLFDGSTGAEASHQRSAAWVREADPFFPTPPQTTAGTVRVQKHV
jgi:hypothetical protein